MPRENDAEVENLRVRMNLLQLQLLSVERSIRKFKPVRAVAVSQAIKQAETDIACACSRDENEPPLQGELNFDRFVVTVAYPNNSEHDTHADVVDELFCPKHETLMDRACGIASELERGQRHIGFSARVPCVASATWTLSKNSATVIDQSSECIMHHDTFCTHAADRTPLEVRVQTLQKADKTICMSMLISDQTHKTMQCAVHVRCGLLTACQRTDNNYVSLVHHCASNKTWLMATDVQKDDNVQLLSHCFHAIKKFMPDKSQCAGNEVHIMCKNKQVCAFRLGANEQSETLLSFTWRLSASHPSPPAVKLPPLRQEPSAQAVPQHIQRARERVFRQCGF